MGRVGTEVMDYISFVQGASVFVGLGLVSRERIAVLLSADGFQVDPTKVLL